jgi:hypothetical protein
MADDVSQCVEDEFNTLVSITEKSGNLRKDLKKYILVLVNTLRKEFSKLKIQLETVNEERHGENGRGKRQSIGYTGGAISGPRATVPKRRSETGAPI